MVPAIRLRNHSADPFPENDASRIPAPWIRKRETIFDGRRLRRKRVCDSATSRSLPVEFIQLFCRERIACAAIYRSPPLLPPRHRCRQRHYRVPTLRDYYRKRKLEMQFSCSGTGRARQKKRERERERSGAGKFKIRYLVSSRESAKLPILVARLSPPPSPPPSKSRNPEISVNPKRAVTRI